ncbi:unnamed protein product [Malus baccata var. baccata]
MRDFRNFVAQNELVDLGYEGYPFTWRNNQEARPIQLRLDHGLATSGWHELYPDTTIRHVVLEGSDHALLLMFTEKIKAWSGRKFSFDARWSKLKECWDLIAGEWWARPEGSHAFRWIMECISSTSFSIIINGISTGFIMPERGLRQGDLLSPYLFLLCTEGLSMLIRNGLEKGGINRYRVSPAGTPITHLFFTEDSVLFGKATVEEASGILNILKTYARGSGQELNLAKSSIFFGSKILNRTRLEIRRTMGIQCKLGFGKYLGLQANFGHSKKVVFEEVRDRLETRMTGWAEQFLSQAGKETLVKAVAMATPNHAMSWFKLPIGVCRDIEKAICNFWCRGSDQQRGIHWLSWDRLKKQKQAEGLRFRDIQCFNLALLAKIGWRMIQNPLSLLATVLRDKYFPGKSLMEAGKGRNSSWGWKGIFDACKVLRNGLRWRVDLITAGFNREDVAPILSIPLSRTGGLDRLVWHYNVNGEYSVRSGYRVAVDLMENGALGRKGRGAPSDKQKNNQVWNQIWKLNVPNTIKIFIWRCCNRAVAVRHNLQRRRMRVDNVCRVCGAAEETENHLFFLCEFSHLFWFCSPLHLNSHELNGLDFLTNWEIFHKSVEGRVEADEIMQEFAFGLWRLWKNRNETVFNGTQKQHLEVLDIWRSNLAEFRDTTSRESDEDCSACDSVTLAGRRRDAKWTKPEFGFIKVNTDAAWCKNTLRMGVGWVCRDFAGVLQAAGGAGTGFCHSAAAGEAYAIPEAILACISLGFNKIIIESDAMVIIKMLRKELPFDFSLDCILDDIEVLARRLTSVAFSFVSRKSNSAAHSVAKYVFKLGKEFFWDCIGLDFLFNTLAKDVNIPIRI